MDDTRRSPDVDFPFDHVPTAPSSARRAMRSFFAAGGDPLEQTLLLATSEMVSNVVLHTDGGGVLRVWDPTPDVPLRIEVQDHDPSLPVRRTTGHIGGLGLSIVEALADDWGADACVGGKVVWAEFDRNAAARRARHPGTHLT